MYGRTARRWGAHLADEVGAGSVRPRSGANWALAQYPVRADLPSLKKRCRGCDWARLLSALCIGNLALAPGALVS